MLLCIFSLKIYKKGVYLSSLFISNCVDYKLVGMVINMKEIYIHPTAEVSAGVSIGTGTRIWNQAQVREGVSIGNNCIIGKNVYIDVDVTIGNRVKIQNNVNVYHGVKIEDDVFLGPSMTFTNDRFPRAFNNNFKVGQTLIKRGASIGANVTVRCDITIGEYAMIGAGSTVTQDVPDYALIVGNPARQIGWVCKCGHRLSNSYLCTGCGLDCSGLVPLKYFPSNTAK